ncbi:P-loop NTPase fold protein [Paenibacillus xylanexedens]
MSIDGAWGTGKSTILNYIEQHLDLHRCSIVRFNPWALSNKEQILFFLI